MQVDPHGAAVAQAWIERERANRKRKPTNRKTRGYQYTLRQISKLPTTGWVYFIEAENGSIKIGTALDVPRRFRAIQSCSPLPLRIAGVMAGGMRREAEIHRRFRASRLHGEWFESTPELLALIGDCRGTD